MATGPRILLLMLLKFIGGTAKNSGQKLDNVNRTHVVLASGKLALQKASKRSPSSRVTRLVEAIDLKIQD